jgi:epoxyqueuosine reductase
MQAFLDKLRDENKISRHPVYRSYIYPKNGGSAIPENFKDAKSVIIMAVAQPPLTAAFHHRGMIHTTWLPSGYYDDGTTLEDYMKTVREEIVRDPAARIEIAGGRNLKQAAVRSGLGYYGRNNICYVNGMGSFLALIPFMTNAVLPETAWRQPTMLPECEGCDICYGICPTGAISRDNFVIDAGKCISLYNEIPGELPNFILPSMHNALMGCMKCQEKCPANAKFLASPTRLEDVTEEETKKILDGTPDEALFNSLARKLKSFGASKEALPVFTRNLKALIRG